MDRPGVRIYQKYTRIRRNVKREFAGDYPYLYWPSIRKHSGATSVCHSETRQSVGEAIQKIMTYRRELVVLSQSRAEAKDLLELFSIVDIS
jgi:hypothetical protein